MVVARRPPRRPRWLVLGVVLTLGVLLVNALASSGSDDRKRRLDALSYADRVRPAIEDSNQQAADLREVRDTAVELGRANVNRRLSRLTRETRAVLERVRVADPPDGAADAHTLLVAALHLRSRASAAMDNAILAALGTGPPAEAVDQLIAVGEDIRASDRAYAAFRDELPAGTEKGVLPPSAWVSRDVTWDPTELAAYVASLRAATSLAPVRDVSIVLVTTRPAPVDTEGAVSVLPPSKSFEFDIVVANVGNVAEKQVVVTATLMAADGTTTTKRNFVDVAPGQRYTLTLKTLKPPAGQVSTLTVQAGPQDSESNLDDNQKVVQYLIR